MSAVIEILKPIYGAKYIAPTEKRWKEEQILKDMRSDMNENEWSEKWEGYFIINGKKEYDIKTECLNKNKCYSKRYNKDLKKLEEKYKEIMFSRFDGRCKFIPVSEVLWRQGWFFNKSLLRKGGTYYATSYDHMKKLLDKFIKFDGHDDRGMEAYRKCLDTFEDGMIFTISF